MIKYRDYSMGILKGGNGFRSFLFDKISSFFIKSKSHKIKNPKNFLFLRNDHIGDMILSTHLFREVKKKFPKSKITVLADPINKMIIEKDKYVDNIIEIDLFWRRRNLKAFLDYLKVLKKIKEQKFDVGVDLRKSRLNMLFFLFIPRIRSRVGYYNVTGGKPLLTHPILLKEKAHQLVLYTDLFKSFGVQIKNYLPHIMTDEHDEKEVNSLIKKYNLKKFIILCPGSTSETKQWPEKKFKRLIEIFHEKYKEYKIIITSGPEDRDLVKRLCINSKCMPLTGFDLRKLVLLFKKAKLAIANDGGVREIASVSGTNLIALAGPVDLELDAPFRYASILHHKLPCYPCSWSKPCKRPCGAWCMDLILVKEVIDAIDGIMSNKIKSKILKEIV